MSTATTVGDPSLAPRCTMADSVPDYYKAYEYTFKADLSVPEHFPHGFSVPDSDDEDAGVSSHWGSQQNPMTFDDSDADSDADSDVDSDADSNAGSDADQDAHQDVDQDADSDHSDTPADDTTLAEPTSIDYTTSTAFDYTPVVKPIPFDYTPLIKPVPFDYTTLMKRTTPHRFDINELCDHGIGPVNDERGCSDISGMSFSRVMAAEYEVTHSLSRHPSESDSELDFFPTSDAEIHSDSEDDGSIPADDHESESSQVNVDEDETEDHVDAHLNESQLQPQTLSPRVEPIVRDVFAPELPSFSTLSQSLCFQPGADIALPHPPTVISLENVVSEPDVPLDETKPVEDALTNYAFMDTMADMGVPNVFSNAAPEASRMQTPPLGAMSDEASTTPPPGRRTGVSITEIIEQQPLTPTSVKGQKRKADVFEDEETMAVDVLAAPEVAASGSQVVNIDLRRPRRQPKSIMAKALKTATYLIPGAAVSFALLANLPDSFFGA
jgi:hypothetical protein